MTRTLLDDYFTWLVAQMHDRDGGRTFWDLAQVMFEKEFVFLVANDDNRIEDGLELRREFFPSRIYMQNVPCSFLEVLVGLSRRLAFQAEGSAPGWAWILIRNLGLERMADPLGKRRIRQVNEILDTVIWRSYKPDGTGGFFPLAWPDQDQTKIEIWAQLQAYVNEIHPEY